MLEQRFVWQPSAYGAFDFIYLPYETFNKYEKKEAAAVWPLGSLQSWVGKINIYTVISQYMNYDISLKCNFNPLGLQGLSALN